MSIFTDNRLILLGILDCYANEYDVFEDGTVISLKEDNKVIGKFIECGWKIEGNELVFHSQYVPEEPVERITFSYFIDPNALTP